MTASCSTGCSASRLRHASSADDEDDDDDDDCDDLVHDDYNDHSEHGDKDDNDMGDGCGDDGVIGGGGAKVTLGMVGLRYFRTGGPGPSGYLLLRFVDSHRF